MRRHSRRPRAGRDAALTGAVALVVALGAGCASGGGPHPFDRLFEQEDWVGAAAVFESDSVLRDDASALYRAGLVYARPGTDVYDPARARALMDELVRRHPDSEFATPAAIVRRLMEELERASELASSLRNRIEDLEKESLPPGAMALYRAGIRLADPEAETFDPERARRNLEQIIQMYPETEHARTAGVVLELVGELGRSSNAVAALRRQLDQLRDVDLRPTTPPPPPPPRDGGE